MSILRRIKICNLANIPLNNKDRLIVNTIKNVILHSKEKYNVIGNSIFLDFEYESKKYFSLNLKTCNLYTTYSYFINLFEIKNIKIYEGELCEIVYYLAKKYIVDEYCKTNKNS